MVTAETEAPDGRAGNPVKVESHRCPLEAQVASLRPTLATLQLLEMNKIATKYQKEGDFVSALAAYRLLFEKAR